MRTLEAGAARFLVSSPAARLLSAVVLAAVLTAAPERARSSPLFGIGDCAGCVSWTDTLNDPGRIEEGTGLTSMEDAFYGDQAANDNPLNLDNYAYTTDMELFVADVTDTNNETHNSLVMNWDNSPAGNPNNADDITIAAWEYVYDIDPDLRGTRILLSLYWPDPSMWDFSIELIDAEGDVRGWFVDIATAGPGGTPLASNLWYQLSLDPNKFAPQGFLPGPIQDPLFDLDKVVRIRLDEAGRNSASLAPPPGGSGTITGQWNAWNSLQVIRAPEPATLALVGLAIVVVGAAGRGARHAT